jgi:hypothetical protein
MKLPRRSVCIRRRALPPSWLCRTSQERRTIRRAQSRWSYRSQRAGPSAMHAPEQHRTPSNPRTTGNMLRSPSPMTQIKFNRFAVYVGGLTPSMCASMKASVSLVSSRSSCSATSRNLVAQTASTIVGTGHEVGFGQLWPHILPQDRFRRRQDDRPTGH